MNIKITDGSTIHTDRTIAKYECWTFETEEEFWKQYDLIADDNTTADPNDLTITKRAYITVEEYREAINNG